MSTLFLLPALLLSQNLSIDVAISSQVTSPVPLTVPGAEVTSTMTWTCSACPPAQGTLHYNCTGMRYVFTENPAEAASPLGGGTACGPDNSASMSAMNVLPAGARVTPQVTGQCYCGNGLGEWSPMLTKDSNPVVTPPFVSSATAEHDGASRFLWVMVAAAPRGSESVKVRVTGPGVDTTVDAGFCATVFGTTSCDPSKQMMTAIVPLAAEVSGALSVEASLEPYDSHSGPKTVNVKGGSSGSGGTPANTVPSANAGDPAGPQGGCSSAPGGLAALASLALALRRERRSRAAKG